MIDAFLFLEFGSPRPDADRIIFCDGGGGGLFHAGNDLELSHWRPNRTPQEYRAGTSTEISFKFLDNPVKANWAFASNNHLDVDGMLSAYTLVRSADALRRRQTIIQAAEMGDFWGWGEPAAARLFQGLTLLMEQRAAENVTPQVIYDEVFRRIPGFIEGTDFETSAIDRSLEPLWQGIRLVEQGTIVRTVHGSRLTHYQLPSDVAGDLEAATYIPRFNESISSRALLWPQARAKWDTERACLVSVEAPGGWQHDLWFPGYLWADVANLWVPPGISFGNGMERYELNNPALSEAVRQFNNSERGTGTWTLGAGELSFNAKLQSQFPVVMRALDALGKPVASTLTPQDLLARLAPVFQ